MKVVETFEVLIHMDVYSKGSTRPLCFCWDLQIRIFSLSAGHETEMEYLRMFDKLGLGTAEEMMEGLLLFVPSLVVLLNNILAQNEMFEDCLRCSYRHANGFDKIVLCSSEHYKLRLHVYGADRKEEIAENVHDHRWRFASAVLNGVLTMDMFGEGPGESFQQYVYNSDKSSGECGAEHVGPATLTKIGTMQYMSGEAYCMDTIEKHRIVSCRNNAITLMLTGSPISDVCNLYSPRQTLLQHETKIMPYEPEQLRSKLVSIVRTLDPGHE